MTRQFEVLTNRKGKSPQNRRDPALADVGQRVCLPSRTNILGVGISVINMEVAIRLSDELIQSKRNGYICATDVHTIIEAQSDSALRSALNQSFLTTPDGMPLVWVAKIQGHKNVDRVYGPDYMLEMCRLSAMRGYRHFFFGGHNGVTERLQIEMTNRFPGLRVVGCYTPPFRPMSEEEEAELRRRVSELRPDIFWIGLGSPKQELFMAKYCGRLETKLMVGVGAAFDFHSGRVKEAPAWLKRTGFQWLYRLVKEPRRLWRRYLFCVPSFLWSMTLQLAGIKAFRIDA